MLSSSITTPDGPDSRKAWKEVGESTRVTRALTGARARPHSSTLDGRGLRNFSFVLADEEAVCDQNFNSTVSPDLEALTRTYGGYTIPANMMGITNIIWSNGTPKIH